MNNKLTYIVFDRHAQFAVLSPLDAVQEMRNQTVYAVDDDTIARLSGNGDRMQLYFDVPQKVVGAILEWMGLKNGDFMPEDETPHGAY